METILFTDGYKLDHRRQYPDGTQYVYSNWTPRTCKFYPEASEGAVVFGLQYLMQKYFIEDFKVNFFDIEKEKAVNDFKHRVDVFLGPNNVGKEHIAELHDLGYLPIEVCALPEGSVCPIGVPAVTVINTHPDFFWITNYLETLISTTLWMPMTSATTARLFKKRLIKHLKTTGVELSDIDRSFLCHDFSMRGMPGVEASILSGLGHLTSFVGSETIPANEAAETYYDIDSSKELISSTVPACYSEDTEILTNNGWKLFKDLSENDLVAEYCVDGSVNFIRPLEIIKDRYKGKMIHFYQDCKPCRIDLLVTPNHRMFYKTQNRDLKFFEAQDAVNGKSYTSYRSMVVSGKNNSRENRHLSAINKLKIAFQADGSYPSHKEDYTGLRTNGFPIRFSLKKQRKMDRLEVLFNDAGIEFSKSQYANGYYSIWANVPEKFYKDFDWVDISQMSLVECEEFIEELKFWDGTVKHNAIVYSSINKSCVDKVQAIANVCGYTGQIKKNIDKRTDCNRNPNYGICLVKRNEYYICKHLNVTEEEYDGYVYCVSVPSKMIIVRRNDKSLVCGNTEHSVMCAGGFEDEFETFKRLITEVYPEGFVSIVSDTWDFWKVITDYMPKLKDTIMNRNGRVVIRPDSGDPVDIIAGLPKDKVIKYRDEYYYFPTLDVPEDEKKISRWMGRDDIDSLAPYRVSYEQIKGAYECLMDTFGFTLNAAGYRIMDSHIGMIYGDSITLERQNEIYNRLEAKGIAATNLVLGIGSYSYTYRTRDSLGFAMKATWCQINDEPKEIFKCPKTDSGFKKSLKGLIKVVKDENGKYVALDQQPKEALKDSELKPVFRDGKFLKRFTLTEIRNNVNSSIDD